jgi:hypothetical protein
MTRSIWLVAVGAVLALGAGQFAVADETAQQTKMGTCNADAKAKSLTGDDRKAFMKDCLSNHPAAAMDKMSSQQEKMKSCNADAKTKALTGDARKSFMKDCLSSHPAADAPAAGAVPAPMTH